MEQTSLNYHRVSVSRKYDLNSSQEEELVSYNLTETNPHYSRVTENKVYTTLKSKKPVLTTAESQSQQNKVSTAVKRKN